MMKRIMFVLVALILSTSVVFSAEKKINIGWTAWLDAEIITQMAKKVLETRLGYEVELTMADIGIQYQGVAKKDLDVMLMAWLPVAHKNYFKKNRDDLVNLGILYTRAKIGLAVPTYIPKDKLASIEDLKKKEVRKELKGNLQGIDPGAGIMQATEKAVKEYGLSRYNLISASEAAMTASLKRSIRKKNWIVVTGWNPHWKFSKWDLRYLEDPKGIFGGYQRVHALARKDLYQDHTDAAEFLARMHLPIQDVEKLMLIASEKSVEKAVDTYLKNNKKRVDYWVTGEI